MYDPWNIVKIVYFGLVLASIAWFAYIGWAQEKAETMPPCQPKWWSYDPAR